MGREPGSVVRVLHVVHVDRIGGGERSLLDFLASVDRSLIDSTVIVPGSGEMTRALDAVGIPYFICSALGRLRRPRLTPQGIVEVFRFLRGGLSLARRIAAHRPDVVHANGTTPALFALAGARRSGAALVWHLRDLVAPRQAERWLAKHANHVVATSPAVAEVARLAGARERTSIIASGIDVAHFANAEVDPEFADHDGPLIVGAGQLVGWKRWDRLCDVALRLRSTHPRARFVIAGDDRFGEEPAAAGRFRRRAEDLGVADMVRLIGHRDDLAPLLKAATVVVHPAFPEPFGRVVVEALAAGRAVVAITGEHGPGKAIDHEIDGLLVAADDSAGFATAIGRLLDDAVLREKLGVAAARKALHFDRAVTSAELLRLFQGIKRARDAA